MCRTWKSWVRPLKRVPRGPLYFLLTKETVYKCFGTSAFFIDSRRFLIDGSGIILLYLSTSSIYIYIPWPNKRKQRHAQCASARTLRMVTMVTVTRLVCLGSARLAREVAVAQLVRCAVEVVARSHGARDVCDTSWGSSCLAIIYILLPHPR